jgi:hypothetical protein
MLIQLPNGQFVNPATVDGVVCDLNGCNVRVSLGPNRWVDIPVNIGEEEQVRDSIAEQINAACYEQRAARG